MRLTRQFAQLYGAGMIESTMPGFIGLGGPEIVVILGVLGLLTALALVVILKLVGRGSRTPRTTCPHCGRELGK
jgi:hypothetical protein